MPRLTKRLETIVSELKKVEVFIDIGCDHGYVAEAMLDLGKCERAIITDVSKNCLKKAETLLKKNYEGRFTAIVADGFKGVPKGDEALIAGMGGELIIDILKGADNLPDILALQPMKNADKVRQYLIKSGYKLIKDYIFKAEKKFYDFILAVKGKDDKPYTEDEIFFGRGNLSGNNEDFKEYVLSKRRALERALKGADEDGAKEIKIKLSKYENL